MPGPWSALGQIAFTCPSQGRTAEPAVAVRLLEIGEAVQGISPELTATEPEIIQLTIDRRLSPLAETVERMKVLLPPEE